MPHSVRERTKLRNRVRRIRGQIDAVERLLDEDGDCERILHTLAATRGAINGLVAELLEDHIRFHVLDPRIDPRSPRAEAADQLVDLVHSYVK